MKKVVLITGCSSGFGYGMAVKFAQSSYITYATIRNPNSEGAKKLKQIAKKENLPLEIFQLDVTDQKSISICVEKIVKKQGRIDILINNAGYGYLGSIEETPIEDVKVLFETNVFGVVRMVQAVVPVMRKRKAGLIVNFSSINGIVPFPLFSSYSATKFAIETLSEGLRFELKHFGINVVAVEPGSYMTNFSQNRKQPKDLLNKTSPYKKLLDTFFTRYKKTHDIEKKFVASKTSSPDEVIEKVFAIAQIETPKARYLIGRDAWKNYLIRKLLPFSLWEKMLYRIYKW